MALRHSNFRSYTSHWWWSPNFNTTCRAIMCFWFYVGSYCGTGRLAIIEKWFEMWTLSPLLPACQFWIMLVQYHWGNEHVLILCSYPLVAPAPHLFESSLWTTQPDGRPRMESQGNQRTVILTGYLNYWQIIVCNIRQPVEKTVSCLHAAYNSTRALASSGLDLKETSRRSATCVGHQ